MAGGVEEADDEGEEAEEEMEEEEADSAEEDKGKEGVWVVQNGRMRKTYVVPGLRLLTLIRVVAVFMVE